MDDPDLRKPRLRGLDPDLLLGVLEDDVMEDPPMIPGWRITGVAGTGGSGVVWRALRASDGVEAAIKIAPPGEPETVERIEREAQFLRELRHPNIVALLDSGPIGIGPDEGGLFLAMEFIDGPALSQDIPEAGLAPDLACRWFRQIAGAVAHAHECGILHRDLKPANVLVAPDGELKVADFGLARPVHRRVHQLSLTRAGLVAGTAEYLPPEAYRRDYQPSPAGDVFALGVMLHEMLTGTPPRGAWRPASCRAGVDIRVDAIVARAMDADPAKRWPDVRGMITALDEVSRTEPRFSGTPLVTLPVRVADALWSFLGFLVLVAGTSSLMRLDQSRFQTPLDLVGSHGELTGGFQALFLLLIATVPLSIWQMFRLRRFRRVPLREALPSPFGLSLGHNRLALAWVFGAQCFFVWIPAVLLILLFLQCGLSWLQPLDPPWVRGLAVTGMDDREIISPWAFGHGKGVCWLWDCFGPPRHGLAKSVDRISFVPFFTPSIMVASGAALAMALVLTIGAACIQWWRRRRRIRCLSLIAGFLSAGLMVGLAWSSGNDLARARSDPHSDGFVVASHMTSRAREHADWLLGVRDGVSAGNPHLIYQEVVAFREHGETPRHRIPDLLEAARTRASAVEVEPTEYSQSWDPENGEFLVRVRAVETFNERLPSGGTGADDLLLELSGTVAMDGHTVVRRETLVRVPMFRAENRPIREDESVAWVEALAGCARMVRDDPRQAVARCQDLFLPVPGALPQSADSTWLRWLPDWNGHLSALFRDELDRSGRLTAEGDGMRTGGISRIRIPFRNGNSPLRRDLTVSLVRVSGSWRCVRFAF